MPTSFCDKLTRLNVFTFWVGQNMPNKKHAIKFWRYSWNGSYNALQVKSLVAVRLPNRVALCTCSSNAIPNDHQTLNLRRSQTQNTSYRFSRSRRLPWRGRIIQFSLFGDTLKTVVQRFPQCDSARYLTMWLIIKCYHATRRCVEVCFPRRDVGPLTLTWTFTLSLSTTTRLLRCLTSPQTYPKTPTSYLCHA